MQNTIDNQASNSQEQVLQVYEVFKSYFGEARTDLQNLDTNLPFILVYWPSVKVTNENGKSILVQDLYAKVELNTNGNIPLESTGFKLNRATYTLAQWESDYMHSHISYIPKDSITTFQRPCLGRGPINQTIASLKEGICEGFDEGKWMLFCEELSRYVTVESLTGRPYRYLEEVCLREQLSMYSKFPDNPELIHIDSLKVFNNVFPNTKINSFILYYLQNGHLAINYKHGIFVPGMSYRNYMIDVSNSFIGFFNTNYNDNSLAAKCFTENLLMQVAVVGDKFCTLETLDAENNVQEYIGIKVCTFKGRDVTLNILEHAEEEAYKTTLLNHYVAMYILFNILKVINYRYTNEYNNQSSGDRGNLPATISKKAYYI